MSETATSLKPPFEFPMSENVKGAYGYRDAHVELWVRLPFPLSTIKKTFESSFTVDELKKLKEGVDKALMWAQMPQEERDRLGA